MVHKSRYVKAVRIAYPLTQKALPRYPHPKRPHHYILPLWAARVRLMFYLDLSHWDREEGPLAPDQLRQALERPTVPDPTTWQRTFRKWRDEESAAG